MERRGPARDSPSEQLRRKIGLWLPALVRVSDRLVAHPRARELYPEYLFTSHCILRASVPVMDAGRRQAAAIASSDLVAAAVASYFEEHIPEELDHDEWLLDDLEVVGADRAAILARPPSPTVAALVGAQYYWAYHYHPVALLGYVAVLEGYPPSSAMIDELIERTGFPREAFRTMIAHAELDPGHAEELDELLNELPLTREQSTAVGLSAMSTTQMLTSAFEEVVAEAN